MAYNSAVHTFDVSLTHMISILCMYRYILYYVYQGQSARPPSGDQVHTALCVWYVSRVHGEPDITDDRTSW